MAPTAAILLPAVPLRRWPFNFTGGTLKLLVWNAAGPFGGNLGNLVQNGTGSVLDMTDHDTTLAQSSKYDLGAGTALIGDGRTFTTNGVLNSAGAGVITVGSGGLLTAGSNAIAVDSLNLDNGSVTAGGTGLTVSTALATVAGAAGVGTINGDLTLGGSDIVTIELNGTGAGQFDKFNVSGNVNFGGSLHLAFLTTPSVGDMFDIFDFAGSSGTFSSIVAPSGTWSMNYSTGVLTYVAPGLGSSSNVPEPASCLLLAMAIAAKFGPRRIRRCEE